MSIVKFLLLMFFFLLAPLNHHNPGRDFFSRHQGALESRLPSVLNPILIQLQQKEVLNAMERAEVMSKHTPADQNFALLHMIQKKGVKAQQVFCEVLKEADPCLMEDLER